MRRVSWGRGGSKSTDEVSRAAVLGGAGRCWEGPSWCPEGPAAWGLFGSEGREHGGRSPSSVAPGVCREVEVALRSFLGFVHL